MMKKSELDVRGEILELKETVNLNVADQLEVTQTSRYCLRCERV
jgi:hypothetical protein